jgi:hypothetical protein
MRQQESWLNQGLAYHPHQVQIDDSRPPALAAIAAHVTLDAEQCIEQLARTQMRQQAHGRIHEIRLILRPHGLREVQP